jgi:hypothetical protein
MFFETCQDVKYQKGKSLHILHKGTEDCCIGPSCAMANLLATRACIKSCITCIYGLPHRVRATLPQSFVLPLTTTHCFYGQKGCDFVQCDMTMLAMMEILHFGRIEAGKGSNKVAAVGGREEKGQQFQTTYEPFNVASHMVTLVGHVAAELGTWIRPEASHSGRPT